MTHSKTIWSRREQLSDYTETPHNPCRNLANYV